MFQNTVTQSKILLHKAKANHFQKYQRALTCLQTHFLQGSAHKSLLLTAYHPGKVLPIQSFKVMHCDTLQINAAERFPALYNPHICQGCLSKVKQALLAALGCQKAPQRKQRGHRVLSATTGHLCFISDQFSPRLRSSFYSWSCPK